MDVCQLGTRPVEDELQDGVHNLDPKRGDAEQRRLVEPAPAQQVERDGDRDKSEHGDAPGVGEHVEDRDECRTGVLMEPAAELDVPPNKRIAGEVVLDDVAEGPSGCAEESKERQL